MSITLYILIAIFLLLFILVAQYAFRMKKREIDSAITKGKKTYKNVSLVFAGNRHGSKVTPQLESKVYALDVIQFKDSNGNVLDPHDYHLFLVDGDSMKHCKIYNNDLIFVTKDFQFNRDSKFPAVMVIEMDEEEKGYKEYKVRRVWCVANFEEDLLEKAKKLLTSDGFKSVLSNLPDYPGDEKTLEDFKYDRLQPYIAKYISCTNPNPENNKVILSTTLNTDKGTIHLSIHPQNKVVGQVVASFNLNEDKQNS